MCGLNAIFAHGADAPPVDGAELLAVRDTMARRGPDGSGHWIADDGRIGLGHRRLTIIDLSDAANQPMDLDGGRLRIAYNGEIYNFLELRTELEAQGRAFRTRSDTEVLLHLYDRDGPAMVERLRGMYAFALWDQARGGLFLARDPLGIKPLYYADDGGTFRVASQVKALLAGGGIDRGPDPAGHVGFFLLGSVPEPHTLYAAIRALPAGATLWVDRQGPRGPESYFRVSDLLAQASDRAPADLGTALRDSLRDHFVADVPVGVFLSAGLDSATMVALAAEVTDPGALRTITLAFDEFRGSDRDEAPLAEATARAFATHHQTRRVSGAAFADARGDLLAAMDQPTIDGVNVYFVARAAAEAGLKVALSGVGGDELFCGYDSFRQIPRLVTAAGWLPRGLGRAVRRLTAGLAGAVSPKAAGFLEYASGYGDAWLLRRGLYMPWELERVLDGDLARAGLRDLNLRRRLDATQAPIGTPARKVMALEMAWYLRNQLLRDADWAGMAQSVEIRTPLVDAVLLQALAPVLGTVHKDDMARTPAHSLPEPVLTRAKTGFSVPLREWLRGGAIPAEKGLRGWAREVYASQWTG